MFKFSTKSNFKAKCKYFGSIKTSQKRSFSYNNNILDGSFEINELSKKNDECMTSKMNYLRGLVDQVKQGGNKANIKSYLSKGKLLPRDRIDKLIDFGSPFLEFSQLASHNIEGEDYPAASLITGIGKIKGTECMIIANDATIKGGTYFPLTVKKHLRAQEIAEKMKLPCIYIVDSSGINISQSRTFPDKENFGKILHNQAVMSSKGIPQLSIVCGTCSGSGAYITSMADETIIVKDTSHIFLSGPHLVEITTGEKVTHNELGSAEMHSKISGLTDHLAENEYEAFQIGRTIIENLNVRKSHDNLPIESIPPLYPIDDIYSLIPDTLSKPLNVRAILARLVDGSRFDEFKKYYGETIITGFARIHGHLVGIIANNGITFSESAMKATHFIQLCDQRRVPLLCLHNTTGFITGKDYERQGITKHMANLVQTISCVSVPKFTVVMGNSFGAGNYIGGTDPNLLFLWPNARLGVMENQIAADLLTHIRSEKMKSEGKEWSKEERKKFRDPIAEQLENQGSALYSTSRIWDDGVIDPKNTRQILGLVLSSLCNQFSPMKSYGVLRL